MDIEAVRESLFEKLQMLKEVTDLQEVCNGLSVNIPPAKLGKISAVRTLLLRYLTSEDIEGRDDQGLAIFEDLIKQVQGMLDARKPKPEEETTSSATAASIVEVPKNGIGVDGAHRSNSIHNNN